MFFYCSHFVEHFLKWIGCFSWSWNASYGGKKGECFNQPKKEKQGQKSSWKRKTRRRWSWFIRAKWWVDDSGVASLLWLWTRYFTVYKCINVLCFCTGRTLLKFHWNKSVVSVDPEMEIIKGRKVKATTHQKRKKRDKNLVGKQTPEDEVDLEEQNGELMVMAWLLFCEQNILNYSCWSYLFSSMISDGVVEHSDSKEEEVKDSNKHRDSNVEAAIKPCNKLHFLVDSIVVLWNIIFLIEFFFVL